MNIGLNNAFLCRSLSAAALFLGSTPVGLAQVRPEILTAAPFGNVVRSAISADGSTVIGLKHTQLQFGPGFLFRWTPERGNVLLDMGGVDDFIGLRGPIASGDGRHVVASSQRTAFDHWTAWAWDEDGIRVNLGSLGGAWTVASAISRDGTTIVGSSRGAVRSKSFRWTESTGMVDLGVLSGPGGSAATAVSDNGEVVVGNATVSGASQAYRWTSTSGMMQLPVPRYSEARAVSGDGQVVLGVYRPAGSLFDLELFLWTAAQGVTVIQSNVYISVEPLLSADGGTVAWVGDNGFYRWTAATGVTILPSSNARSVGGVSDDGHVMLVANLIGSSLVESVWTEGSGFEPIQFPNADASAFGMSADGQRMAGGVEFATGEEFPVRWSLDGRMGDVYCSSATPNSTGSAAALGGFGLNLIGTNDLTLRVTSLPVDTFGFFLASLQQDDVFPVSQSQGRLCLGGAIGRFVRPHQIKSSGATGVFEFALPMQAMATPSGARPAAPGESWNFQAWYRDANPQVTSNFSQGLRVTLM